MQNFSVFSARLTLLERSYAIAKSDCLSVLLSVCL